MTAFREVERTVEFEPIDGWVYRITEFDDGSKCPPSIPWRGLDICYAKPKGRGRYTVYEVVYRDVMTVDVEYALVPGTKE